MRTETRTYTLYRITELSEEAKEKAHGEWLYNRYFYGWTYENRQTLDAFANTSVSCAVIGDMTHVIIAITTAAGRKTA